MSASLREAARAAEPALVAAVSGFHGLGFPDALVHGDLHTQNLAGSPRHPVIFDWTDACIGHPYLDARHLVDSAVARRADGADAAAVAAEVRDAFLHPWREALPDLDHEAAWELSARAEAVFTLISYEQIVRAQAPVSRWELGGIVVELLERLVSQADTAHPGGAAL
jgi:aminoglycoside phosphotransferase (APT) family kinase protein